jgi:hypothetical protein
MSEKSRNKLSEKSRNKMSEKSRNKLSEKSRNKMSEKSRNDNLFLLFSDVLDFLTLQDKYNINLVFLPVS